MNTKEAREILDNHWNYVDVLALAVAQTKSDRLDADPAKWHQLFSNFQEQTRKTAPELLKGVFFDRRHGMPPFSDQVDHFFFVMGVSGSTVNFSPAYDKYEMSKKVKKIIIERKNPLLVKYHQPITELAQMIDEQLGTD